MSADNYFHVERAPTWNVIWLLFDLGNGDAGGRTYFWAFPTRKAAMEHRKKQHSMKNGARLSLPIKAESNWR